MIKQDIDNITQFPNNFVGLSGVPEWQLLLSQKVALGCTETVDQSVGLLKLGDDGTDENYQMITGYSPILTVLYYGNLKGGKTYDLAIFFLQ